MDYSVILQKVYTDINAGGNPGAVATYIPELGKVDPETFGACLTTTKGEQYAVGDAEEKFSIQSIAKVLSLSLAFKLLDDDLWKRVGVEPSGDPFNSLVQLEYEQGIPRNPLINAGAIVVCDVLCSYFEDPQTELLSFIRQISDNPHLEYDTVIAASEKSEGYRNFALVNYLKSLGNIQNEVNTVIDFYFHLCSIKMNCRELSQTFLFLANGGKLSPSGTHILPHSKAKRINAIMSTCGFYDEAGEFAFKVGLPGKSGVGGGIAAVLPSEYSIAVWSPRLNPKGNSYRGMRFLEEFTTLSAESIF